jgi:hypothetical protein
MLRELSRRSLLKTLAGSAAALPLANLLGTTDAHAQGTTPPLRFIAIFTPHGCLPEFWNPQGSETEFTLDFPNSMLSPLEVHKNRLLVLDGLDYRVLYEHGLTGHEGAPVTFLTGSKVSTASGDDLPQSASLDQVLGNAIGGTTKFRSIQLNAWEQFGGQHVYNSISFTANGSRVPFERDPAAVYQRLFGNVPPPAADPAEALKLVARRRSVLDFLVKDATRLQSRLAAEERQKLEAHLEALRDIERRLGSLGTSPNDPAPTPVPAEAACGSGTVPPAYGLDQLGNLNNMPTLTRLHMDLIARAFACDLTRVVTMTIPGPSMPWINVTEDVHNDLAHRLDVTQEPLRTQIRTKMASVQRWYAEQVAYLMTQLASVQEGSGTALDNTLILWGNEMGDATGHMNVRVPTVLAGGAGGRFRMGRFLRLRPGTDPLSRWSGPGTPLPGAVAHNRLLVSIANAFGVNVNTFGHPDYAGPLPGLT